MTNTIDSGLSISDKSLWDELRKKVRKSVAAVHECFAALKVIRDKELYRDEYKTFDAYIKAETEFSKSWVYEAISNCETREKILEAAPEVPKKVVDELPSRLLSDIRKLTDDQRGEVFAKATELAGDRKLSQEDIKAAMVEVVGPPVVDKERLIPKTTPVAASDQGNMGDFVEKPAIEYSVVETDVVQTVAGEVESKPSLIVDSQVVEVSEPSLKEQLLSIADKLGNVEAIKVIALMLTEEERQEVAGVLCFQTSDCPRQSCNSGRLFPATHEEQVKEIVGEIGSIEVAEIAYGECTTAESQERLLKHIEKLHAERKAKPSLYSDNFEAFWAAYPDVRKKDKKGAFEAWKKAIKELLAVPCNEPEGDWELHLVNRAGDYAKSWQGNNRFSRMPSTWLNQRGWEDSEASWEIPEDERKKLDPGAQYKDGKKVQRNWDTI